MPVVTEVISPGAVPLVARYADILQIGARNMQNYALLEAVGRERKPVLLKRGLMSTIEELLLAAEYILSNGNHQVMLCERGIRTFETRHAQHARPVGGAGDQAAQPPAGDRRPEPRRGPRAYVESMARAAVAAGADGIIVEMHPDPAPGPLRRAAEPGLRRLRTDDGRGAPGGRGRRPADAGPSSDVIGKAAAGG